MDTPEATVMTPDRLLRDDFEPAEFTMIGAKAYLARLDAAGR